MDRKLYDWDEHKPSTDDIAAYFRLFLGRDPKSRDELNPAIWAATLNPVPRWSIIRYFMTHPEFNMPDLYPIFADQMTRSRIGARPLPKTNLFCVGAGRCGTTTLGHILDLHKDVYISPVKETNFFHFNACAPSPLGRAHYDFYFHGWNKERIIGDFSPAYLPDAKCIKEIHAYNSQAKVIICLRNPADRAISDYFYLLPYHKNEDIISYFGSAIAEYNNVDPLAAPWFSANMVLRKGLYYDDVALISDLGFEFIITQMHEFSDVDSLYRRVCKFIDIDPVGISPSAKKHVNQSERREGADVDAVRSMLDDFYAVDISRTNSAFSVNLSGNMDPD